MADMDDDMADMDDDMADMDGRHGLTWMMTWLTW